MTIVDQQLVNIEIIASTKGIGSELSLKYQSQAYRLYQAFALSKLDELGTIDREERIIQQCPKLVGETASQYLLVRETAYYSLWEKILTVPEISIEIEIQQASIWLFQELWFRLEDLLGAKQLQGLANILLDATPVAKEWSDLDRLLRLDPASSSKLVEWQEDDFVEFTGQLYHLTQSKLGHKFVTEITVEIITTMPTRLQALLVNTLNISAVSPH